MVNVGESVMFTQDQLCTHDPLVVQSKFLPLLAEIGNLGEKL